MIVSQIEFHFLHISLLISLAQVEILLMKDIQNCN